MLTWWLDEVFFETFLFRKWVLWISELQEMFLKYDEKSEIVWCILILLEYNLRRSLACTVGHSFGKGLMVEKDKEKYRYPDYHLKSDIGILWNQINKKKTCFDPDLMIMSYFLLFLCMEMCSYYWLQVGKTNLL